MVTEQCGESQHVLEAAVKGAAPGLHSRVVKPVYYATLPSPFSLGKTAPAIAMARCCLHFQGDECEADGHSSAGLEARLTDSAADPLDVTVAGAEGGGAAAAALLLEAGHADALAQVGGHALRNRHVNTGKGW